jgi:hypothetical protein
MKRLLLCALFLGAEIGWIVLAVDAGVSLAIGITVFGVIAIVFGRLIGNAAFLVPIVPVVVVLVLYALDGGQTDSDGENTAALAVFFYLVAAFAAEAGVGIGVLWRTYARWKTPRNSATVSANAESVASGS